MSWSTKQKAFCVEAYFANNSYKVVQESFRRKFQCRHAPSKSRIFDWIQKFRECGTVENLNSKCLRDTYSGRTVSARTQRNIDAIPDSVGKFASNAVEAIWSIFWKEHDFYVQWLKLWEMIVDKLKFKTSKLLEVFWISVGFYKIFIGSLFLGSSVTNC